jgi:GGDEF domain-containing protein
LVGERAITVSIGYACHSGTEFESAARLFEAADAGLYSAKEKGRNCVAAFEGRRTGDPVPRASDSTAA